MASGLTIALIFILVVLIILILLIIIRENYHLLYYNSNNLKAKIAIITIETRDNLKDVVEVHNKSLNKYCSRYGYDYIFKNSYKSDLPVYWYKMLIVKEYLPEYDYVLWLDSDTIICDYSVRLEWIIQEGKDIYIGRDYPSFTSNVFCAGIFMIKNSEEGKNFINDCINGFINNDYCKEDGKPALKGAYAGLCYEQGMMNYLMKGKYKKNTLTLPDRIFNNSVFWRTNSFILHYYLRNKKKVTDRFLQLNL